MPCMINMHVLIIVEQNIRIRAIFIYSQWAQKGYRAPCGTLKCENAAICEKVAKCEKNSTLNVKIDAICEQITLNFEKMRLSKCIKHFLL